MILILALLILLAGYIIIPLYFYFKRKELKRFVMNNPGHTSIYSANREKVLRLAKARANADKEVEYEEVILTRYPFGLVRERRIELESLDKDMLKGVGE